MSRPTKDAAKQRLQRALAEIPALKELAHGSQEFAKWHRDTRVAIENTFEGSQSRIKEFNDIRFHMTVWVIGLDDELADQRAYTRDLEYASTLLQSMVDEIEEYWDDDDQGAKSPVASATPEQTNTNQIFIIHGRDHGSREMVARFLESLGLEPVILQEQPDEGQTIIEKFEQYAQCAFAVALFTPDDVGGLAEDGLQPRTRQNVIFEFGYFIGKYGRDRVRALVKGDPEIPSDYSGVLYIPLDESGAWKFQLVREMKSAGFDIDANRAF